MNIVQGTNQIETKTIFINGRLMKINTLKTSIQGYPITLIEYKFNCYNDKNVNKPDIKSVWACDLSIALQKIKKQYNKNYNCFDLINEYTTKE
jgi:hypothetical protein